MAIAFGQPTCRGSLPSTTATSSGAPSAYPTTGPVPTCEVRELRAIACAGLDASGSRVSIWGSAGGPVRRVTVTLGDAARTVSAPAELPLRDNANGSRLTRVVCLPGAVSGTAGFLSMADSLVAVTLQEASKTEVKEHRCGSGTKATRAVIDPEKGAGLYSGTIDINGAKEGGGVKIELHERVGIAWFLLLVGCGVAVASFVAWMVRVRRPWGAVQRAIATLRVNVSAAQTTFKDACPAAHAKWTVVGPVPAGQDPAFDAAVRATYAHIGLTERVFGPPPASLAEAGEDLKRLKDLAAKYRVAAVQGAALARWLERQGLTTEMPFTRATVQAVLFGPPPDGDTDPITTLATAVSAALDITEAYARFVRKADSILSGVETPTDLVLQKYLLVRSRLTRADLTIASEKADVEAALSELQDAADAAADATDSPPSLRPLTQFLYTISPDELTIIEPPPPVPASDSLEIPSDKTPTEWFTAVTRKNRRYEIATLIIGAAVSFASAWQTLYVSEYDWGTGAHYLGAFAFAIGTTSGVQIVRHLTVGILDK